MIKQRTVILFIVILSLGITTLYFSFRTSADTIQPAGENNRSGDNNKNNSTINSINQNNSNNSANSVVSIPLKKPPFIKDK